MARDNYTNSNRSRRFWGGKAGKKEKGREIALPGGISSAKLGDSLGHDRVYSKHVQAQTVVLSVNSVVDDDEAKVDVSTLRTSLTYACTVHYSISQCASDARIQYHWVNTRGFTQGRTDLQVLRIPRSYSAASSP